MRVTNLIAAVAVMIFGSAFLGSPLLAQQPAAASNGTRIAVVDVGFIVKNNPSIKQQQTAIREQVKAAQEDLAKRREALIKDAEKLKVYNEGTPEFNQVQERLAAQEAQLKLDMVRKEKELDETEAAMALQFYNQLQTVITQVAEHNQIDLVLRSNREAPDIKQPATIQMALEKGVVYNRAQLDITDFVLKMIVPATPAATPASTGSAPVQSATAPAAAPQNNIRR